MVVRSVIISLFDFVVFIALTGLCGGKHLSMSDSVKSFRISLLILSCCVLSAVKDVVNKGKECLHTSLF